MTAQSLADAALSDLLARGPEERRMFYAMDSHANSGSPGVAFQPCVSISHD